MIKLQGDTYGDDYRLRLHNQADYERISLLATVIFSSLIVFGLLAKMCGGL